jgi:hypothetical protein
MRVVGAVLTRRAQWSRGGIVERFRQTSVQCTHGGGEISVKGNGVGIPFYDPNPAQSGAAGLVAKSFLYFGIEGDGIHEPSPDPVVKATR